MSDIDEAVKRLEAEVESDDRRCRCLSDTNQDCNVDHQRVEDLRSLLDAYEYQKQRAGDLYSKGWESWCAMVKWRDRARDWRLLARKRREQVRELKVKAELSCDERQLASLADRYLGSLTHCIGERDALNTQLAAVTAERDRLMEARARLHIALSAALAGDD